MKRILLNIIDNDSGRAFKCNILENIRGWECVVHKEFFRFKFLKEDTLIGCLESLAEYLEPMHDITVYGEESSNDMYVAILKGYIRILSSDRLLHRRMH